MKSNNLGWHLRPVRPFAAAAGLLALLVAPAQAAPIVGVTGQRTLVAFDSAAPAVVTDTLEITGSATTPSAASTFARPLASCTRSASPADFTT
jgi:hypothetical protein